MSCVLSTYSATATIFLLFILPIEIECCSMTTYDIISLMSQNPDYKHDPCYMEWKAAQDEKLTQIWTQRDQLEESMADYNRRRIEQEARDREDRHRNNTSRNIAVFNQKESAVWKVLGIIAGAVVGICCCVACVAATRNEDNPTRNTTNLQGGKLKS